MQNIYIEPSNAYILPHIVLFYQHSTPSSVFYTVLCTLYFTLYSALLYFTMYGTLYLRQYSVTLYFTLYSVISTVLQTLYVELYSVINTVLFTLLCTPYSIVYTLSSLHCNSYSVLCIRYTISLLDTEL